MTSLPDAAIAVINAFLEVRPDTGTRAKILLGQRAEALLRAEWDLTDVTAYARAFAAVGGEPGRFAWWATRSKRERAPRGYWTMD